jgi:hypothetical protein
MRKCTGAVVSGLALCLMLATSCTGAPSDNHPHILPPSESGWAGASIPDRRANVPYPLVGGINLCLDRPGSVEVIEVTMEHTEGGFRIDAYAFRPMQASPEGDYHYPTTFTETLWELGFESGSTTIDLVCPEELGGPSDDELADVATESVNRGLVEFGIQFSKPTDATARGAIIRLTYRSGGKTYVHRTGFELILCEQADQSVPECDFRDYPWP